MSFFWKYVVSIAIGAVLVWLAFRGEDWAGFGERLRSVDVGVVCFYLGLFAFAHSIRIVRWGVLVRALGPIRWRDIVSAGCSPCASASSCAHTSCAGRAVSPRLGRSPR